MRKLKWGILSTAKIGTQKVIPALQLSERCEVVAISSRDQARAAQTASELGISRAFGSYEELLADSDVDAIYNPLPNHMHVEWSIKAIEAGKHVLCEKPIGLSSVEGQRLVDVADKHPSVKVMEAFMYRHHPQWQKTKQIVGSGEVGQLRTIQSFFSYFNDDAQNIRNQKDIGGGALMDIGCYNISLSRFLFDEEPTRVMGLIEWDPNFGTDRISTGILEFPSGTSTFSCSTQMVPYQRVNAFGTAGRVEIEIPFNAPPDRPCKIWHQSTHGTEEMELPKCDQYTIQGDLFAKAVFDDEPVPTSLDDAVKNMQVIETIVQSAQENKWVEM